jgi:hypothetical protein
LSVSRLGGMAGTGRAFKPSRIWRASTTFAARISRAWSSAKAQRFPSTSKLTGFQAYSRKARFLAWLNAVAVDIDLAHEGQDFCFDAALHSILTDAERRGVPTPSIVCNSGRGLWAIWLLRDRRYDTPVAAWPNLQAYAQKISQLAARMFRADPHCTDAARVMRWPGSINPNAAPDNRVVAFYRLHDRTFTLDELGAAFGLKPQATSLENEHRREAEGKSERHVKAGQKRWMVPLDGFLDLRRMRGGFCSGTRTMAVFYYAMLLRKNRRDEQVVLRECMKLAEECCPPLDPDVARKTVASSRDARRHVRHDTLVRDLQIAEQERKALPMWFKPVRLSKIQQVAQRRAAIDKILKAENRRVSLREMAQILAEKHRITVSYVTIRSDYKAIGKATRPSLQLAQKT